LTRILALGLDDDGELVTNARIYCKVSALVSFLIMRMNGHITHLIQININLKEHLSLWLQAAITTDGQNKETFGSSVSSTGIGMPPRSK
jgi:hypothetical protein